MVILIVMNSLLSNLGPRYSRRNSTTPIILGFLLLIIAIAVATYFLTRDDDDDDKDKKDENTDENVPSIEDPTVTRTLLPDSSNSSESGTTETYEIGGGKTETYKVEYNNGISDIELSQNVKIGIKWSNKSGFENVTKLDIEHYINDVKKNTKSINRNDDNENYFTNYAQGLTHEFQGLEPYEKNSNGEFIVDGDGGKKSNSKAYSFVGTHTVKIIATYTDSNGTAVNVTLSEGTTTETVEVETEDLAATLELTAPDVRVFTPIQGSFKLGEAEIDNQTYYATSGGVDIHKSIDINNLGPRPFTLIRASTSNSNQFYFKFSETEYLGYDSAKNLAITTSADQNQIITLVSSSLDDTDGTRYFRLSFGDDLYAIIDENGNGAVKAMAEIGTKDVYDTLDWNLSTTTVCVTKNSFANLTTISSNIKEILSGRCRNSTECGGSDMIYTDDDIETELTRLSSKWFSEKGTNLPPNATSNKRNSLQDIFKDASYSDVCTLSSSGGSCDEEAAKICLEELMEATVSTSFKATADTTEGNACSIKYNCAPDIWF